MHSNGQVLKKDAKKHLNKISFLKTGSKDALFDILLDL